MEGIFTAAQRHYYPAANNENELKLWIVTKTNERRTKRGWSPAGAALSAMLSVTLTRHPVSTLTAAPRGVSALVVLGLSMSMKTVLRFNLKFNSPYQWLWYQEWKTALRNICRLENGNRNDEEFPHWFRISGQGYVIWLSDPQVRPERGIKLMHNKIIPSVGQKMIDDIITTTRLTLKKNNASCEIDHSETEE